jgi:short-subunit dehydrogenase
MQRYGLLENLLFWPTYLNKKKLGLKLESKTVLITGASSGIGEQLAYMLADINVHLILVARTQQKLLEMKGEIEQKGARVSVFVADLRLEQQMQQLLTFIHQLPDGLDVLVSNAGKSIRRPIDVSRYHDFTRTMAINYFAPVELILSTIPILKKSHGQIINISTINALLIPIPKWAAYQASKTAFDTWLRSAAAELKVIGISTTSIYLPLVRTPMILPTVTYQKMPAMSPTHAAKIICKSIYTKKKKYVPWWLIFGQIASVIFRGFLESLMPYRD